MSDRLGRINVLRVMIGISMVAMPHCTPLEQRWHCSMLQYSSSIGATETQISVTEWRRRTSGAQRMAGVSTMGSYLRRGEWRGL